MNGFQINAEFDNYGNIKLCEIYVDSRRVGDAQPDGTPDPALSQKYEFARTALDKISQRINSQAPAPALSQTASESSEPVILKPNRK